MTPALLIKSLAEELRQATKNFKMTAEYQANKPVTVYEQFMPLENFERDTFYPLIVVELQNIVDSDYDSVAEVGLTFGVYGGEAQPNGEPRDLQDGFKDYGDGWRDLLNLAECVRQYILLHPIIGGRFLLKLPARFETLETQPAPFFLGGVTLQYAVARPAPALEGF